MTLTRAILLRGLAEEILAEADHADADGTHTSLPDGTNRFGDPVTHTIARAQCVSAFTHGIGTWRHLLDEDVAEAYTAPNSAALRAELIQVAATALRWAAALDARDAG